MPWTNGIVSGIARKLGALRFDATINARILLGAPIGLSSGVMTVELDIIVDAGGAGYFSFAHNWVANGWLFGHASNGRWDFRIGDPGAGQYGSIGDALVSAGQRYLLNGVYDGATTKLYVNGVLQTQQTVATFSTLNTVSAVQISWRSGTPPITARVNKARYYNRPLAQAEITEHVQRIYTNETGLKIYWPLNEGGGTVVNDVSGIGNHGVMDGVTPPTWVANFDAARSIALAAAAPPVNAGDTIWLRSGLGTGQMSKVVSYDPLAKVAYLDRDWAIQPDNTTSYEINGGPVANWPGQGGSSKIWTPESAGAAHF